jgi:hypothetical protein
VAKTRSKVVQPPYVFGGSDPDLQWSEADDREQEAFVPSAAAIAACDAWNPLGRKKVIMPNLNVHALKCELKKHLDSIGGITKDRTGGGGGQGYAFRGIDDLYNKMCLKAAELGLDLDPQVVGEPRIDYQTNAKGNVQTHTHIVLDIVWTSAHDMTSTRTRSIGEAIDTSDKAAGKAMSYAMKNGCFAALQIPTHGEALDVEAYNHQNGQALQPAPIAQQAPAAQQQQQAPQQEPAKEKKPRQSRQQNAAPSPTSVDGALPPPTAPNDPGTLLAAIPTIATFPLLHSIAADADKAPSPVREQLFGAIEARIIQLFQAAGSMKEVQEGFPLVKAMGEPASLKSAANAAYVKFRQPQAS